MSDERGVGIAGLGRRFGGVDAVRDLSLEIHRGETFGLLGPNGAGKTTTLSMLSTLLPPSAGDARIFGHSLRQEVTAVRRAVGLAPQEISLYPDLTGEENLHFFGRIHGVRGRSLGARSDELLELVGLESRRHDRVRTYSGGMQRRLNLACSLVHDPRLLLLDEPTVGVDPRLAVVMLVCSLGGCWWPLYQEPDWLRQFAWATPTAWAMDGIHDLILRDRGFVDVLPALAALSAYGLACLLLGVRLYRFAD